SIFSNKRNVLNTVFVKLGWAWTSTPLLFLMPLLAYSEGTTASSSRWTRVAKAAVRWSLATVYWALLTQWFFGYSVFDRVLIRTGSCSLGGDYSHHKHCHAEGGRWDGFDISGHCLLLIHSSLFALEELFPLRRLLGRQMDNLGTAARAQLLLGVFLLGIVALWAVMLLATSLYFHDWQEKLLGSFLGSAFWLATY
ncbi:Fat storage-inducing transmembrane protein, partial [Hyaloraphidium curvatum]